MEEIVLVLTTLPEDFPAAELARALVEAQHAACVSILPSQLSIYRWQGAIETTREHQVVIKTTVGKVDAVRDALRANHPYEVPELLVLPVIGGGADYLQWLRTSLGEGLA